MMQRTSHILRNVDDYRFRPGSRAKKLGITFGLILVLPLVPLTAHGAVDETTEWPTPNSEVPPPGEHPRILFSKKDIPAIRERANTPIGKALLGSLRWQVDAPGAGILKQHRKGEAVNRSKAVTYAYFAAVLYTVTEDKKYLDAGNELLSIYAEGYGEPPEKPGSARIGRNGDALALTYDILHDYMPEALRVKLKKHFLSWLDPDANMESYLSSGAAMGPVRCGRPCDWGAITAGAAVLTYCAVEGEDPGPSPRALEPHLKMLQYLADYSIYPEGHMLSGTQYIDGDYEEFFYALLALKRRGIDFFEHPNIRNIPVWLVYETLPGLYSYDNRNQANGALSITPTLVALGASYDGPAKWLQTQAFGPVQEQVAPSPGGAAAAILCGDFSKRPAGPPDLPLSYFSSSMGTVFSRSGWGADDSSFTITMEPPGGGHTHQDKGSFTFHSHGLAMAADSGVTKFAAKDHNTVLIGGRGQLSGQGHTDAIVRTQLASQLADITHMDLTPAYAQRLKYTSDGKTKVKWQKLDYGKGLPFKWVTHRAIKRVDRYAVYVRSQPHAYAVIVDHVQKDDAPHNYTWLLHSVLVPVEKGPRTVCFRSRFADLYVQSQGGWGVFRATIPQAGDYRLWMLSNTWPDLKTRWWWTGYKIGNLGSHRTYLGDSKYGWGWQKLVRPDGSAPWALPAGELTVRISAKKGGRIGQIVASRNPGFTPGFALTHSTETEVVFPMDEKVLGDNWSLATEDYPAPRMEAYFLQPSDGNLRFTCGPKPKQTSLNRLAATQTNRIEAVFGVVLLPVDNNDTPATQFELSGQDQGHAVLVRGEYADTIAVGSGEPEEPKPGAILHTDAVFALVREHKGDVIGYAVADGTQLSFKGKKLIASDKGPVSIVSDNESCRIQAPQGAKLSFFPLGAGDVACNRCMVDASALRQDEGRVFLDVPVLAKTWDIRISDDGRTVTVVGDGPKPLQIQAPKAIKCVVNGLSVFFSRDGKGNIFPKLELAVLTHGNEPYKK